MPTKIIANFDLCTGCGICQLVCSQKTAGTYNPRNACLLINMEMEGVVHKPVVCNHCENAFCQKVCVFNAITRDEETGAVEIDEAACKRCRKCAQICPIQVIYMNEDRKAVKCDLCSGDPLCVKYCPTGALRLVEL